MKKRLKILHKKTLLTFLAIITAATPIIQSVPVEATNDSVWANNGELQLHLEGDALPDHLYGLGDVPCDMRQVPLTYRGKDQTRDECLVDTEYGSLKSAIWSYFMPRNASKLGLLDMGNASWLLPVPNQEKVLLMTRINAPSDSRVIHIYNSYEGLIEKSHATSGYHDTYRLSRSYDASINKTDGSHISFRHSQIGFSRNGKWMIARVGATIIRVNLATLEVLAGASSGTSATGNFDLAISNDGGYGAIGNTTSYPSPHAKIIDFTTCSEPNQNNNLEIVDGCGERDLGQDLLSLGVDEKGAQKLEFSDDGTMLSMNVKIDGQNRRATVSAPGYEYSGLDYLALGDSFASGEGDLEGKKYYLAGTDVPAAGGAKEEKCHISRRSYPYLLAQRMNLSGNRFKSVACSGATTKDIIANKGDYEGQGRRLKDSQEDLAALHDRAIEKFTPGHAPQLEFVERYKPRVVSLSIGGNDVDFNNVIIKCLMPGTCDYVDDSFKRRSKAQEVQRLTHRLEQVYKKIHEKSRNTKIYVVGYPKIAKKNGICASNVKFNEAEREFLSEGVKYINEVTQAAAQRAGVAYIDVENSLGEGVLCGDDAEKSMNGLTRGDDHLQALISIMSNHLIPGIGSESYHPNQRGHAKMVNAIWSTTNNQGLLNYNYCPAPALNYCPDTQVGTPSIPGYFGPDHIPITPQRADIVEQWAQPGDIRSFKAPYLLKPNSNIKLEVHSNPTSLGTFTTDSRGEFSEDIEIPDSLEPGVHTIHLKGTLLSDEEVHMYQTILIVGSEDDIDGDGINDDQQECYFVEPAGIDTDFDSIDDGCDGDIGEPQLYRVRNGDTGNGENEDWLYIERNTRAASVTGIQNDYDPDGDGWAIVGQSTTSADSGVPANFWVDEQNVPHVSMRHPETGCTQLTAATLTEVEQGQTRGLLQEAANTNTCREEAPEYDSDWDGVPDNAQILYRVRSGDMDEAENPDDVYIERNVIAAEAQLGITDFSHNQNDWAIIGVSDGSSMQGTFGDIIIENDAPYVCVDHMTNGKIILTPESLEYVKQSDARKSRIETGTGVDCGA